MIHAKHLGINPFAPVTTIAAQLRNPILREPACTTMPTSSTWKSSWSARTSRLGRSITQNGTVDEDLRPHAGRNRSALDAVRL